MYDVPKSNKRISIEARPRQKREMADCIQSQRGGPNLKKRKRAKIAMWKM